MGLCRASRADHRRATLTVKLMMAMVQRVMRRSLSGRRRVDGSHSPLRSFHHIVVTLSFPACRWQTILVSRHAPSSLPFLQHYFFLHKTQDASTQARNLLFHTWMHRLAQRRRRPPRQLNDGVDFCGRMVSSVRASAVKMLMKVAGNHHRKGENDAHNDLVRRESRPEKCRAMAKMLGPTPFRSGGQPWQRLIWSLLIWLIWRQWCWA